MWLCCLSVRGSSNAHVALFGSTPAVVSQCALSIYTPELLSSIVVAASTCSCAEKGTGYCYAESTRKGVPYAQQARLFDACAGPVQLKSVATIPSSLSRHGAISPANQAAAATAAAAVNAPSASRSPLFGSFGQLSAASRPSAGGPAGSPRRQNFPARGTCLQQPRHRRGTACRIAPAAHRRRSTPPASAAAPAG